MKIVFFGTSPFAASLLDFLLDEGYDIVAIVTRPDRPKGRSLQLLPSPVKQKILDKQLNIPVHTPEKASTEPFAELLKTYNADLFLVVAYGEIIKQNILDIPEKGCINVHASLLPKYRGAAPMQRTLMNGETESGITIIEMALKMDAGPMLIQEKCSIDQNTTLSELDDMLLECACIALKKVLQQCAQGTVTKIPQDETLVTFAPKITAEETKIDWTKSAQAVHNHIRALSPRPGAWTYLVLQGKQKRLKIIRTQVEINRSGEPGEVLSFSNGEWIVACGEGAISLLEVQLEGKKALPAAVFIKGISSPHSLLHLR